MGRIIPWDLPKINGGSVGGYTPEPTPEPPAPEITGPYDLTDFVISLNLASITYIDTTMKYNNTHPIEIGDIGQLSTASLSTSVTTSGVKIIDTSNVSQVIAHCKIPKEDMSISDSIGVPERFDILDYYFDCDISAIMGSTIGGAVTPIGSTTDVIKANARTTSTSSAYKTVQIDVATATSAIVTSIDVYNANGVPLQTWTPPEDPEPPEVEE